MPLAEALESTLSAPPAGMPGAIWPGAETLAGSSMALLGTVLPSGSSAAEPVSSALAGATARLSVQAPESRARGTRALAFCHLVMRWFIGTSLPCRRPPGDGRCLTPVQLLQRDQWRLVTPQVRLRAS